MLNKKSKKVDFLFFNHFYSISSFTFYRWEYMASQYTNMPCHSVQFPMDIDQEKGKAWRFLAGITRWHIKAEQTHLSVSHIPSSSHLAYSPFVPKKDIFVSWGITILTSRDELLIERRGQRWHAADYSRYTELKHSYLYVCVHVWRNIHFSLSWYVSIEFCTTCQSRQTRVVREEKDVGVCLLCGPHELSLLATLS